MRKTFNVTEKDMDIIPHLEKQVNMSQYIISLIKHDMGKKRIVTEDQIIELIKRYTGVNTHRVENSFPMDTIMNIIK